MIAINLFKIAGPITINTEESTAKSSEMMIDARNFAIFFTSIFFMTTANFFDIIEESLYQRMVMSNG